MSRYIDIRWAIRLTMMLLAGGMPGAVLSFNAQNSVSEICNSAAQTASVESGVPFDVLLAISLTETGRQKNGEFQPWPWTVNMEGVGKWFGSLAEAREYTDKHFRRGARSFDVGCFQINYRWHGHHFGSVDDMFDPLSNARYAAKFLSELFHELGSWSRAAGAYHSRTPKFANRYRARFDRIRNNLPDATKVASEDLRTPQGSLSLNARVRVNRFPLLQQNGAPLSPASLVRLSTQGSRFIEPGNVRALGEKR